MVSSIQQAVYQRSFLSITRERNTLKNYNLSQKIPLAILHRMVSSLTRKNAYLESEIGEIGHFRTISVFLTILSL